jgi:hypothetical protein
MRGLLECLREFKQVCRLSPFALGHSNKPRINPERFIGFPFSYEPSGYRASMNQSGGFPWIRMSNGFSAKSK